MVPMAVLGLAWVLVAILLFAAALEYPWLAAVALLVAFTATRLRRT